MRPLNTFDLDGHDIALELNRAASVQMIFKWPGDERTSGSAFMIADPESVVTAAEL